MAYFVSQIVHCDLTRFKKIGDKELVDEETGEVVDNNESFQRCKTWDISSLHPVVAFTWNFKPSEGNPNGASKIQLCEWYMDSVSIRSQFRL